MKELRELRDFEEIRRIYNGPMQKDFPDNERKPLRAIRELFDRGAYRCYGLYEADKRLGYAFLVWSQQPEGDCVLLDYLAVDVAQRNAGLGTELMKQLAQPFSGADCVLIEAEDPDCAQDEAVRALRARRVGFYTRCSCRLTGVRANVFGADYVIFEYPTKRAHTDDELAAIYEEIYRQMLPARMPLFKKVFRMKE